MAPYFWLSAQQRPLVIGIELDRRDLTDNPNGDSPALAAVARTKTKRAIPSAVLPAGSGKERP